METVRNLTAATEAGHDRAVGIVLVVMSVVALLVWAAAEFQFRRGDQDRTAVARAVGVLRDRRDPAAQGAFADAVESRLQARGEQ